jgi:hypothetical protein
MATGVESPRGAILSDLASNPAGTRFTSVTVSIPNPGSAGEIPDQPYSRLLTASCTTGWRDWVHGALWLCPDGLLRISIGLAATIAKGDLASALDYEKLARQEHPVHDFSGADIRELLREKRTNVWVPWLEVQSAAIRYGLTADRLRLTLRDGRTLKFLWLPDKAVTLALCVALESKLGPTLLVQGLAWRPWS